MSLSQHRRITILSQQLNPQQNNTNTFQNLSSKMQQNPTSSTTTSSKQPIRVLLTGAAGAISYSLLAMIASGQMFGKDQPLILHLLEIKPAEEALKGVVMELRDSAYELVEGIVATIDEKEAFNNIDFAIFVGAFPRRAGMERKDLLQKNAGIFKSQARFLDQYAKKTVKVLVVGNPANTNCLILQENAKTIPKENFSALTRLDHNRAKSQIALHLNVPVSSVHNVIIWGNHSSTQYPDVNHAYVTGKGSDKTPVRRLVNDDNYLHTEFVSTVQKRGAAVIAARKLSSATSAAKAITDHMRNWVCGTKEGEIVSMAVPSDGSYGIKEGVIYSYPVRCSGGKYHIVQGLAVDGFSRKMMTATDDELRSERKMALEE